MFSQCDKNKKSLSPRRRAAAGRAMQAAAKLNTSKASRVST